MAKFLLPGVKLVYFCVKHHLRSRTLDAIVIDQTRVVNLCHFIKIRVQLLTVFDGSGPKNSYKRNKHEKPFLDNIN